MEGQENRDLMDAPQFAHSSSKESGASLKRLSNGLKRKQKQSIFEMRLAKYT